MKKMIIIAFLAFVLISPIIGAEDSECGSAEAWVKLDDGEWQEAGVYGLSLDIYEEFEVKVTATTKVLCHVDVLLQGAGKTVTFEVVNGPLEYGNWVGEMNIPAGETRTFESTVRPTDNKFVGGTTPLSMKVQFTPPGIDDDNCQVSFGLINPKINNQIWEGYTGDSTDNSNDGTNGGTSSDNESPSFEIIIVLLAISILMFYRKKIKP